MKEGLATATKKKIIKYCPGCPWEAIKTNDVIFVAQECPKHKPNFVFVPTGIGKIRVPAKFLTTFKLMTTKPVINNRYQ